MKHLSEPAALLVIDLERGFIDTDSPLCIRGAAATLPACQAAITAARTANIPVFFIHRAYRPDGSDVEATRYPGWLAGGRPLAPNSTGTGSVETPPEVTPQPGDYVILKPRFSAFFQTNLDLILRRLGVRTLYLTGTTTPNCIRTTCYDGLSLDYNMAILTDCCSSNSPEIQAANLRDMDNIGATLMTSAAFCAGERAPDLVAQVQEAVRSTVLVPQP